MGNLFCKLKYQIDKRIIFFLLFRLLPIPEQSDTLSIYRAKNFILKPCKFNAILIAWFSLKNHKHFLC